MMENYITLKDSGIIASINPLNGQLVSLFIKRELIHPGGRFESDHKRDTNGWANSGLIMFPIVCASKDNTVSYMGEKYFLDQHGIIRSLIPECSIRESSSASIIQSHPKPDYSCIVKYRYTQKTKVDNIKYIKGKENPKILQLPFSFDVSEEYLINAKEKRLEIETSITNLSEQPFCYALGRHPAFTSSISNAANCAFYDNREKEVITLDRLMELSKTSAHILHGESSVIAYDNQSKQGIKLWTDFGNIMLWSPKPNMFCIEPISEKRDNDVMVDLSPNGSYTRILHPNETRKYHTYIMVVENIR